MNKKLPSIFKNTSYNIKNNNKETFYSLENNLKEIGEKEEDKSVLDEYLFNIPVEITTYDRIIDTKIVSKIKDHILTNNNEVIKLKDIRTVKRKNHI